MTIFEWAAIGLLLVGAFCFAKGAFAVSWDGTAWMIGAFVFLVCGGVIGFLALVVRALT